MKLSVSGDYINMLLRQMGATSIKHFDSKMNIVNFDLGDGLIVSYVYNVTRKNKYFLQRMDLTFIFHLLSPPLEIVNNRFPDKFHTQQAIHHVCLFRPFPHHPVPKSGPHASGKQLSVRR